MHERKNPYWETRSKSKNCETPKAKCRMPRIESRSEEHRIAKSSKEWQRERARERKREREREETKKTGSTLGM